MLLDTDLITLCDIPDDLTSDLITELHKLDWNSEEFSRPENALKTARVVELPFMERGVNNTSVSHRYLYDLAKGMLQVVQGHYPGCVFLRGELAALRPGMAATLHRDRRWFHEHSHRLHVPLITNDKCKNIFVDKEYHLNVGTLYEINNRVPHGAYNNGDETRVHCIIDMMPAENINKMILESINRNMYTCEP